ncbi:hypothetical protein ABZ281_17095 [Streptomyces sp. NPDC006265]|uniref:hypothetical protein n=1 Tax=Streptomyces sp. NPDC006265 TaxID=3156740 RepID=UPI0033B9B708
MTLVARIRADSQAPMGPEQATITAGARKTVPDRIADAELGRPGRDEDPACFVVGRGADGGGVHAPRTPPPRPGCH